MIGTGFILGGMLLMLTPWLAQEFDRFTDLINQRRVLRKAFKATEDDGMFHHLIEKIDALTHE